VLARGCEAILKVFDYVVARQPSREQLVKGLIRVGEQELTGEDEAEVDAYFAPDFVFHGPDGAELDYEGLKGYFASLRAAFDDLTISRGIIVVEGDYIACQTTIAGTFVREFTHSPVGPLPPNGRRLVFELVNIFRYDEQGRLAEEWVQTDNRSRLRQLGAEGR
jgi:predicted ester cyclase